MKDRTKKVKKNALILGWGDMVPYNIKNGKKKKNYAFFFLLKGCLLTILFMYSYTVWRNATNVFPSHRYYTLDLDVTGDDRHVHM